MGQPDLWNRPYWNLYFGQAAGAGAGYIKFLEDPDHGTNTVTLIGAHSTADVVITLPATTGTVALVGTEKLATFAWDGGGAAITVGATSKRCTSIPYGSTITGWTLINEQADTLSTAIYKDAFNADAIATTEITGTAPIRTGAKVAATSTTLTGWTTAVTANDFICAQVTTCGAATWANVVIWGTR